MVSMNFGNAQGMEDENLQIWGGKTVTELSKTMKRYHRPNKKEIFRTDMLLTPENDHTNNQENYITSYHSDVKKKRIVEALEMGQAIPCEACSNLFRIHTNPKNFPELDQMNKKAFSSILNDQ